MPLPSYELLAQVLQNIRIKSGDHFHVRYLLASLLTIGLSAHRRLGNQLVDVLVKGNNVRDAHQLFRNPVLQEVWPWNAGIVNYLQCGEPQHALTLYRLTQDVDSPPHVTKQTLTLLLKTCIRLKDVKQGLEVHAEIARTDLAEIDAFVSNLLLELYTNCGFLSTAQQVFSKLPIRDITSWNVLISGLTDYGRSEEALNLYDQMNMENVSPDAVTFVSCLKACGCIKATEDGVEIYAEAERKGISSGNPVLGAALVDMYIKCGSLKRAQEVFNTLAVKDAIVWTSLITGYNELGQCKEALHCFERMQYQGVSADAVTFICSLKACGSLQNLNKGQMMHINIHKQGFFEENVNVGNALLDMYCRCGALDAVQHTFECMPAKDVVSWNTLISGYVQKDYGKEAIAWFEKMQLAKVCPSPITFICSLQACGSSRAVEKGREIHSQIMKNGVLELDVAIGSVLVSMYGNCGELTEAQKVFSSLPVKNVVTWNALITVYVEHSQYEKAISCVLRMKNDGLDPNIATFVLGLSACSCLGDKERGEMVVAELQKRDDLEGDLAISSALVDMHAKCGCLIKAQQVFDGLHVRGVVAWTCLITGYAEYGHGQEALNLFDQMQLEGVTPNSVTLLSTLKACTSAGGVEQTKRLLEVVARKNLHEGESFVGNALVAAYAKCGWLVEAQEAFESLQFRDVISWNVLILGYIDHDYEEDALECLSRMQLEGVAPDNVTCLCILKACGKAGAIDFGQETHVEIERKGLLEYDVSVGSALVDMYSKWGFLSIAHEALDKLPFRSIVAWNALISGYAQLGESGNVLLMFNRMITDGMMPDCITFVSVLSVCSLTGMIELSQTYFEMMSKEYGITPVLEHYSCLVDLLGRTGETGKAELMVHRMPIPPNIVIWHALLSACRKWGNAKIGKQAFESAIFLSENDGAAYALVCDIYAGADK